jgi:hypothetical protein|tara:strand:- start:1363 stop:1599 length:237 start_codon:yes stop_codon:yes gene_type:complete
MPQFKDYFKTPLAIDDWVAVEKPSYRNLVTAKVVGFTPKQVRLKYRHQGSWCDYLCYPNVTIRVPEHLQPTKEDVDST